MRGEGTTPAKIVSVPGVPSTGERKSEKTSKRIRQVGPAVPPLLPPSPFLSRGLLCLVVEMERFTPCVEQQ